MALRHPPARRAPDLRARELLGRDGHLGPHLGHLRLRHLQGHLRRQVVLVGDAAGLQQVLRPLLLGQGVGCGWPRPPPGRPRARSWARRIVGFVEHGQDLPLPPRGALVAQHLEQAGLDLGHHLHLGPGPQGAGEDQHLVEVAGLHRGRAHGHAPRLLGGGGLAPARRRPKRRAERPPRPRRRGDRGGSSSLGSCVGRRKFGVGVITGGVAGSPEGGSRGSRAITKRSVARALAWV